jgi:hypothetical protein
MKFAHFFWFPPQLLLQAPHFFFGRKLELVAVKVVKEVTTQLFWTIFLLAQNFDIFS